MSDQSLYEQIVEMRFNKDDFEKNISKTITLLDEFKQRLDFKKSVNSLDSISNSLEKIPNSFDKLTEPLKRFDGSFQSLLKNIANGYLFKKGINLLDSFQKSLTSTVKSMSGLGQMQKGWEKFEQKTQAVQTIMAATGKSIDEVNAALSKLNWYSDETSYSFTDMTNNIGKFTSAGVDLKDAVSAMEGISNWTATSGQDLQQASRVMYNVSQAISAGKMLKIDWKSVENANMATKEFKETAIETAVSLGKLKKVGDEYYTTIGKKQKVTVNSFAESLSTGWFDKDTIIATLKRYSEFTDKVYDFIQTYHKENPSEDMLTVAQAIEMMKDETDTLGKKWLLAAQEAKTFKEVVDATKDAVSTAWMNIFEIIFGNYEEARELWKDLADEMYELLAVPMQNREEFLYDSMTSGYKKLKDAIEEAGLSLDEFETTVLDFIKTNPEWKTELDELIETYGSFQKAMESGEFNPEWIFGAFADPSTNSNLSKTTHTLEEVEQVVKDTFGGKYGSGQERIDAYKALGYDPVAMQKLVNNYSHTGKVELEDLQKVGIEAGKTYSETWGEFIEENSELIESFDQLSGRQLALMSFWNIFGNAKSIITSVKDGISDLFNISPESFRNGLEKFYNFTEYLKISEGTAEKLKNFVSATVSPFKSMAVIGKKFVDSVIGNAIEKRIPVYTQFAKDTLNKVYTHQRRIAKVFKSLEDSAYVNKAINVVSSYIRSSFAETRKYVKSVKKEFNEFVSDIPFVKHLKTLKDSLMNIWKETNTGGKNAFDTLIETFEKFKASINPIEFIKKYLQNGFEKIKTKTKTYFSDFKKSFSESSIGKFLIPIGKTLKDHFSKIFDSANRLPNPKSLFTTNGFFGTITNVFDQLKQKINNSWIGKQISPILKQIDSLWYRSIGKFFSNRQRTSKTGDIVGKLLGLDGKNGITNLKNGLKNGLINENAMSYLNRIPAMFEEVRVKITDKLTAIKDKTTELWESYKQTGLYKVLSDFWNWSRPLLKTLTEKLVNGFTYGNVADLFRALATFNVSRLSKNVGDFIGEVRKQFKNAKPFETLLSNFTKTTNSFSAFLIESTLPKSFKVFTDGFAEALHPFTNQIKATNRNLNAEAFMKIAIGIGIVAGALYLLLKSGADLEEYRDPAIIIGGIGTMIAGLSIAVSKLGNTNFDPSSYGKIIAMSFGLLLISAAVTNLAKAVAELKDYGEWYDVLEGVGAVIALMFASLGSIKLFGSANISHTLPLILTLMGMVFAIRMLVKSVFDLKDLDWKQALVAVGSISVLMLALAGSLRLIGFGPLLMGSALTIMAIAGAVRILAGVIQDFVIISAEKDRFAAAIGTVITLIVSLGAATALAGLGPANILGGAALSLVAMAAAIRIIVGAVKEFANIPDPAALERSVDAIRELLLSLGGAVALAGLTFANFGKAATIFAFVAAIYALQNAVESFGKIPYVNLRKGIDAVTELLGALKWATFISGLTLNALGGAASILAFAKAIQWITDAIVVLCDPKITPERLNNARNIIVEIVIVISALSVALGVANRFKLGISNGQIASIVGFALAIKWIGETLISVSSLNTDRLTVAAIAVGGISLVLSVLIALMGKLSSEKLSAFGGLGMLLGFANAVKTIGDAVINLSKIDQDALIKGGRAVGQIIAVLSLAAIVISHFPLQNNAKTLALTMIGIAAGLSIIADVIEKLGDMNEVKLRRGGGVLTVLLLGFTAMVALLSLVTKMATFEGAAAIVGTAVSVYIIARAFERIASISNKNIVKSGIVMAALITAVGLVGRFAKVAGSDIRSAVSLTILAAAASGLALVAKTFSDMEWPQLLKTGVALTAMAALVVGIGRFVKLGSMSISLGSVAKIGLVIAEIAGIFAILGGLYSIGPVADWLHSGGNFLMEIGRALGGFFGAIVGGFQEGVAQSMPAVGSAMASFAENAKPFFDLLTTYKDIDPISSIKGLSDALSDTVWADFLARITKAFATKEGENGETIEYFKSIEAFGNSLKEMVPGLTSFVDAFKGLDTNQITSVNSVVDFVKKLSEVSQEQISLGFGGAVLTRFASDIEISASSYASAIEAWNEIPTPTVSATSIVDFLSTLSEVKIPTNIKGGASFPIFSFWFEVKQSFTEFAKDLSGSITDISTFLSGVNGLTFEYTGGKTKAQALADMLASLAKVDVPTSGGVLTWFANHTKDFQRFANDLATAIPDIDSFIQKANAIEDYNSTKVTSVINIIAQMAGITRSIDPNQTGGLYQSYSQLVAEFIGANDQINTLASEIDESNIEKITLLLSYLDGTKSINTSFLDAVPGKIQNFVQSISSFTINESLTNGLNAINAALAVKDDGTKLQFETIAEGISSGMGYLTDISDKDIKHAESSTKLISSFISEAFEAQKDFDSEALESNLKEMVRVINEQAQAIEDPGDKLKIVTNFLGSLNALASISMPEHGLELRFKGIFTALQNAIDGFHPDQEKVEYIQNYKDWLESFEGDNAVVPDFSGWDKAFGDAAAIIDSFTVDESKFNAVSRFLELLQNEFKNPTSGVFNRKDKNYFSDLSDDMLEMDKKFGTSDFAETEKVTGIIDKFIRALSTLSYTSVDKVREKMVGIFGAINDAVLGDGSEENKGIGDLSEKLDPISEVMATLQSYSEDGLKDVIPNILTGITDSINNFTFDQTSFDRLEFAIKQIATDLGLLDPDTGASLLNPKNGLKGSLGSTDEKHRRRPESKADALARKLEEKTEIEETIKDVSPSTFDYIASAIAKAISSNSKETQESMRIITEDMLLVLESFNDRFHEIGVKFVRNIVEGIYEMMPEAMEMSAMVATNMLASFDDRISQSNGSGQKFIQQLVQELTSDESVESIQNAIKSLFTPEESTGEGVDTEFSIGKEYGSKFITDFAQGLSEGGISISDTLSETFTNLGEAFDLTGMSESIAENVGAAIDTIQEPISELNSVLSGAVPDGYGLANAMIDGIIAALQDRLIEACTEMSYFASMIAAAAKNALGIASPSKVFYWIGENVVEGFDNAIDDNSDSSRKNVKDLFSYSEKDLKSLRKFINKYGKVTFNGREYTTHDLKRINSRIKLLEEERKKQEELEAARKKAEKEQEALDKKNAKGGGGGASKAVEEGKGVLDTVKSYVVNGVTMTVEQLKEAYNHVTEDGVVSFMGKVFDKDSFANAGKEVQSAINDMLNPVITPTVDNSKIKNGIDLPINPFLKNTSRDLAASISKKRKEDEKPNLEALRNEKTGSVFNLTQNINSPKAVSRAEIYRQTKNQFAQVKNMIK